MKTLLAVLLCAPLAATPAWSATEPPPSDKTQYHLLHPTPRQFLRPLATDRPDVTESPITVDAGRYQVETDILRYTRDSENGVRSEAIVAGSINLKAGLLHNVDLQVILDASYLQEQTRVAGVTTERDGFGDITARLKINLWGNEGDEPTALGVMPFLRVPTASAGLGTDAVEGGLIVPFAIELPDGWALATMAEFDFFRNAIGDGYHTEFVNTVSVGHEILGPLAGYVEFISVASTESGADWRGLLGLGLTCGLGPNTQLDLGVNLGLSSAADDVSPFLGFSFRY